MTNYELFWLRELPGGALGGEYGGRGKSLADLPINETLAGRIHRLSVPGETVNLHLPYLSHRDRKIWPAMQLELPVRADEAGRIVVGDEADHQYASVLAAPGLAGYSAPILFRDERVWKASEWDTAVVPMLAAHKIPIDRGWKPSGPVNLRWTIELPSHLATGLGQRATPPGSEISRRVPRRIHFAADGPAYLVAVSIFRTNRHAMPSRSSHIRIWSTAFCPHTPAAGRLSSPFTYSSRSGWCVPWHGLGNRWPSVCGGCSCGWRTTVSKSGIPIASTRPAILCD